MLFFVALAVAATGGAVGLGIVGASGALVLAVLVLARLGCAVIAITGPPPVCGRWIRACLAAVAIGLLSLSAEAVVSSISTGDPLASMPIVVLAVGGLLVTLIGIAATGVTLVVAPWSPRLPGVVILAGLLCLAVAVFVISSDDVPQQIRGVLEVVGFAGILVGGIWIGVTAFKGEGEGTPAAA